MDLAVSPDLDAFWCYLIVLFFGAVTAIGQVRARLGNLRGIWVTLSAWLLFLGYWAVPVVLFWFLDRTGAINDTSVFAALLVGVGYQQILAGSLQQVKAPGDVSRFWQPFLAWADRVAQRVLDRVRLNAQRFKGKVIDGIVGNDGRFDALKQLALAGAPEPQAVKTELDKIAALKPLLDDASVHGKQADYLYRTIAQVPDFQFLLKEQGITSRWDYFVYALEGRSIIVALVVALLALGGTAYGAWRLSRPTVMCDYYAWRLEKVKTTPLDQFRARQSLAAFLSNQATAQQTHERLARLVRRPGLPMDRVDAIILLLLERRTEAAKHGVELEKLLVEALRADSVDARSRVHSALLYLTSGQGAAKAEAAEKELTAWKPTEGDSPSDLETKIGLWRLALEHHATAAASNRNTPTSQPAEAQPASTGKEPTRPDRGT